MQITMSSQQTLRLFTNQQLPFLPVVHFNAPYSAGGPGTIFGHGPLLGRDFYVGRIKLWEGNRSRKQVDSWGFLHLIVSIYWVLCGRHWARCWGWSNAANGWSLWFHEFYLFMFVPCSMRILDPWPGLKSVPSAVEAWNPNHWIVREVPHEF